MNLIDECNSAIESYRKYQYVYFDDVRFDDAIVQIRKPHVANKIITDMCLLIDDLQECREVGNSIVPLEPRKINNLFSLYMRFLEGVIYGVVKTTLDDKWLKSHDNVYKVIACENEYLRKKIILFICQVYSLIH